ncbi:MAG TPA: hypothetical protein VJ784_16750 [Pyrinomonadaceae bacterium]|nr:hypothetical protein [Pyrinomonadaceae bacterium]
MAIYWDRCDVTLTNQTKRGPMTFSSQNATTGFIDGSPTASIAAKGGTGGFTGSATSGLLSGCGGTVVYSLTDGTLVNINYWTAYPYGPADSSTYTVGFQGANANFYKVANNNVQTDHSNGGAGKRVHWTFDVVDAD